MRVTVLLGALAVVFSAVAVLLLFEERSSDLGESVPRRGAKAVVATGVVYQSSEGEGSLVTLHVEKILRQKRKFSVFSINPLHELVLTGARLTIRRDQLRGSRDGEGSAGPGGMDSALQGISRGLSLSRFTKIVVNHLDIEVQDGGATWFSLRAETAVTGPELRRVEFPDGLLIEARRDQRLEATRGRWLRGTPYLEVLGSYRFRAGASTRAGANAFFELGPDGTLVLLVGSG
jgi:hypothetical protein